VKRVFLHSDLQHIFIQFLDDPKHSMTAKIPIEAMVPSRNLPDLTQFNFPTSPGFLPLFYDPAPHFVLSPAERLAYEKERAELAKSDDFSKIREEERLQTISRI